MEGTEKHRSCLICSVPISEVHLGIDSCRNCAVFYKRIRATNRPPMKCRGGDGQCVDKDASTSCRKCRFDRFSVVLNNAFAANCDEESVPDIPQIICDPFELRKTDEKRVETQFIDHNTFLEEQPSSSDTPLLDKIRWSYSLLCQTRKSGEIATKPDSYQVRQGDFDGSEIKYIPTTYSMMIPNAQIFAAALFDFAKISVHHFPDDLDKNFTSYTSYASYETLDSFLDDCPFETNKEEAIEAFKVEMKRTRTMNREPFHRVKPDDVEFLALLGLSFWNREVGFLNDDLSEAVEKNRNTILKELRSVYKSRGKEEYATRLGELFTLLDNNEENVTLTQYDVEVYRLLNMFNEAYPTTDAQTER